MPDTRKPSRASRDPRIDSTPPSALDEAPLGSMPRSTLAPGGRNTVVPGDRSTVVPGDRSTVAPSGRRASDDLEAEVERLRIERESDADEAAGMLVQIAQSERMRVAAQSQAEEAGERAGALQADLDQAMERIDELEIELAGLRQQWVASEARLNAAHETMSAALGLLEDLERREEMTASMRARSIRDTLRALGGGSAESEQPESSSRQRVSKGPDSRGPDSSVEILGTQDVDWELELAES